MDVKLTQPVKGDSLRDVYHATAKRCLGSVYQSATGWHAVTGGRTYGPFPTRREAVAEVWIQGDGRQF